MERKEFVSLLGLGAGALVIHTCLGACGKSSVAPAPAPGPNGKVDFTISNIATNAGITSMGYTIQNSIIIAKNGNTYLAVSSICTHQGTIITYNGATNKFPCPAHGSVFNADGSVNTGPAQVALKSYSTQIIGADLRVYEV
jgi:Rieske Fe-S protein